NQLVASEASVGDLKQLHDQSIGAAQQARQAVQDNASLLQEKLNERTKLLSQLEQAKMQEEVSASLNQMSQLSAPGNTPSLEDVRDKIEKRYTTALGSADLASNSVQGRLLEVKKATTNMAAQSRLEEIRASMATPVTAGPQLTKPAVGTNQQPAIEDGGPGSTSSASSTTSEAPAQQPADPQP
ncbi:MAG: hypothetical protein JWO63_2197, partial [Frankiales bacterium]|nr:hypothetical protein [Frankiales bacterium]